MAILVDPAYLPATLTAGPLTDGEFAALCEAHPEFELETDAEGLLQVMPLTFTLDGCRKASIGADLCGWAKANGRGNAFDSSTGFVLPNGARRSPDAGWLSKERVAAMDQAYFRTYWRICPDFVIELQSQADSPRTLRKKMQEWIANGAQLAWLLDPEARTVEIYRPGAGPQMLENPTEMQGEGPVDGFVLDLTTVWDPLA